MSITKTCISLLVTLAVSVPFCASPAAAGSAPRPDGQTRALVRSVDGARPGTVGSDSGACVRACALDQSPCDPVAFKRADGRCAGD